MSTSLDVLSHDETLRLIRQAQKGDVEARNQIITGHLPLLKYAIRRRFPRIPCDGHGEWLGSATEALIRVIYQFDTRRGIRFSTYATRAVLRQLNRDKSEDSVIRIPYGSNHNPLSPETARLRDAARVIFNLTREQAGNLLSSEEAVDADRRETWLRGAIAALRPIQRYVVRRRLAGQTLHALGAELRLTKERVRQIQLAAVRQLREMLEHYGVEQIPKAHPEPDLKPRQVRRRKTRSRQSVN